jgi:hypothetical protein
MIDLSSESLLTFSEASQVLPRRRRGRKAHPSTFWRWASRGLRGVRLEIIRVGGVTYTSREALQRFADRLSSDAPEQSSISKERPQMSVEQQLANDGI